MAALFMAVNMASCAQMHYNVFYYLEEEALLGSVV